jgi:hypothetical protein
MLEESCIMVCKTISRWIAKLINRLMLHLLCFAFQDSLEKLGKIKKGKCIKRILISFISFRVDRVNVARAKFSVSNGKLIGLTRERPHHLS